MKKTKSSSLKRADIEKQQAVTFNIKWPISLNGPKGI